MVLKSRKKFWHTILFSWVSLLILFTFMILLGRGVWGMYHKNARAEEKAQDALYHLDKISQRKDTLNKSLTHIKTSMGVEEELRRKFDVAREGEHLLVIVDKEVTPEVVEEPESWMSSLWQKFTH